MIDRQIRKAIDPALDLVGKRLSHVGVTANMVTVFGFGVGCGAALCLMFQMNVAALILILISRLCDGLDGSVARITGQTDLGAFLDITLDFIFYSGIVFAFAVGYREAALPAAFLIFSFVGTGASFLAYAVIAEKRGLTTEDRSKKSLLYIGGLTEGFETIVVLCLICSVPQHFTIIAWIFGGLCWITTSTRIFAAIVAFRSTPRAPGTL